MGTSVGSKAVTLKQAIVIAGILEFTGAVLFGQAVSEKLATGVVNPELFADAPQTLLFGMIAVLIAAGIWLNIATVLGFPVSSSHATVGAIAGVGCVAIGMQAVHWRSISIISLTWLLTPVVSGAIAALFYSVIKRWILDQPNAIAQLKEWIPFLSATLISVFGVIVLPTISQPIQAFLIEKFYLHLPAHDIPLIIGILSAISLTFYAWNHLDARSPESVIAKFQVVSACFVAFAHGSNDVGNAISPFAAVVYIHQTNHIPLADFDIPLWILALGGVGIVAGLAIFGKNVITTIGENIIALQPSGGFCAELATATTILIASRFGLPVSTSHALVGGVVGIGLVQGMKSIRLETVRSIVLTWLITIPLSAGLGAIVFKTIQILSAT
jgi:PiT family inorganic phosphate transporter